MLRLVASFEEEIRVRPVAEADRLVVGSGPESDWLLPFPGVSRRHARIGRAHGGVEIRDLASKNGVVVGGERVDRIVVRPGEAAVLGRATVSVEEVSSTEMELALAAGEGSDSRSGNAAARVTAPVSALRLVRDLDRLSADLPEVERSAILAEVARAVGAEALWTFAVAAEDVFLRDCVGPVPGDAVLGRMEAARLRAVEDGGHGGPIALGLGSRRSLLVRPHNDRMLLVVELGADDHPPPTWVVELLEHLAEKLVTTDRSSRGARRGGTLRIGSAPMVRVPRSMLLGRSRAIQELLGELRAAAQSDLHVLVRGETGTGKELVARALHHTSDAASGPFVAINCVALQAETLEPELLGVAATVAAEAKQRPGRWLQASGGTLFLDRIGELPEGLQATLLRVLEERETVPVGGERPRAPAPRLVAATNADLRRGVESGSFRSDLYHRISGMEIHVPPLRDRVDDIPELVTAFVNRCAERYGRHVRGVSRKALSLLMAHEWPGNVRELEHAVERAVLLCPRGGALESRHFAPIRRAVEGGPRSEELSGHDRSRPGAPADEADPPHPDPERFRPLRERLDAVETRAIREALSVTGGDATRAAGLLGITPSDLKDRIERLGL